MRDDLHLTSISELTIWIPLFRARTHPKQHPLLIDRLHFPRGPVVYYSASSRRQFECGERLLPLSRIQDRGPRVDAIEWSPPEFSSDQLLGPAKASHCSALAVLSSTAWEGLYLAYNLLGGKRGPLRQLSRVLTYSAIFGLGYGITLGVAFGLAGALVSGPTIDYELRRRAKEIEPTRIECLDLIWTRLSFGIAGWMAVSRDFGVAFSDNLLIVASAITEFFLS